ncbi:hypothetical protein N7462_007419 [Penicillium macrosclerotiorum]|uniref:uncharacterized protein n=1 Tax=Penicillium macrosclerotiorum TaxID=303699 RepID=UPI002549B496|nr:uncharacterized protein N7462_007419 [Penicillium macrosclerotiorum]KAJ5679175.1 hypothetical protein N7462_007419 [Penicillium macrosclerotiorum]
MTDHDPMIRKHAYRALRESPLREEYLSDQNASHAQSSWSVGDNLRGTQSDATTFAAYPSIPKFSLDTLLGQLEKHSDADVRESAAKSIGTHYHLTDRALDILESGLGDPAMNVKDAVARILEKQSNLPDRILTALSSRLERDMGTRKSPGFWPTSTLYYTDRVTDILNGQKYLPESILLATVAQLKRGTGSTFGGLEQILWKHDYLSYLLRDTDALRYVYRDWIHRSMIQQLACYVKDDGLHVIAMHGRKVLSSPLLSASDIRMILFDETSAIESPATRWYTIC